MEWIQPYMHRRADIHPQCEDKDEYELLFTITYRAGKTVTFVTN